MSKIQDNKEHIARIPVYRKCSHCAGTGTQEDKASIIKLYHNEEYEYKQPCIECNGKGRIETDYFIEVPKEFPKLKEWWL